MFGHDELGSPWVLWRLWRLHMFEPTDTKSQLGSLWSPYVPLKSHGWWFFSLKEYGHFGSFWIVPVFDKGLGLVGRIDVTSHGWCRLVPSRGAQWQWALFLLSDLQDAKLYPNQARNHDGCSFPWWLGGCCGWSSAAIERFMGCLDLVSHPLNLWCGTPGIQCFILWCIMMLYWHV